MDPDDFPYRGLQMSADGRLVVFASSASNLAPNSIKVADVYLRDRVAGTTERLIVRPPGTGPYAEDPVISADGATISFTSSSPDLVAGDGDNGADVFVRAR